MENREPAQGGMKVHIFRTRMAMSGCNYAYDGLVLTGEVDKVPGEHAGEFITICRDGKRYYSFEDATRPAEISEMERGWPRYQAAVAHEKAAQARLLELAKRAFPELEPATKWPTLWVEIPTFDGSHARKTVVA